MFKSSGQPAPVINQPVVSTETPAPAAVPAVDAKLFDSARYYMIVAELTEGPFAFSDIASLIGRGLLTKESMLWKKGMINWEPAANFQELSPLFSTAP